MASNPTALFDACVLYSAPLRDLIMHLAVARVVQARWSGEIHEERMRNVAANRPDLSRASLERCRGPMDRFAESSLVVGYESLISGLTLPDPGDRHVLAAAVQARVEMIVTFNLRDFPASAIHQHGIEAVHPDAFLIRLWRTNPTQVAGALQRQRVALKNPPKTSTDFPGLLRHCGLSGFVAEVIPFADRI